MSDFMKIDPRANKGLCSSCMYLSVRVSDTGDEIVICKADNEHPQKINKKISACTEHEKQDNGPKIDSQDAWYARVEGDGEISFQKDNERYMNGKWYVYTPSPMNPFTGSWVPKLPENAITPASNEVISKEVN